MSLQRHFQPNVYISHVRTNDLPTDMTPEEISEKVITFSICHSNINVKRHLNESHLHLNDHDVSALVRNFKNFLTTLTQFDCRTSIMSLLLVIVLFLQKALNRVFL